MVRAMADGGQEAVPGPGARTETAREVLALRNLVAVYRHLSGLAVQDADLAAVTRLISEQTDATVAVVSPTMDILTAAAPGQTGERAAQDVRDLVVHPRLGEVLGAASRARRALRLPGAGSAASVIVAPVLVGDDVPAHLLTVDTAGHGTGEDTSLLLTEHAATICGVILSREQVVAGAASRARRALRLPGAGSAASVIVAPVLVGDDVPAHLLTVDTGGHGAGEDTSLLLTEHAATICGVILSRERVVATAASRVRDDLVEGLLSGRGQDVAETGRWARHLGYDPGRQHHVLSVAL